MFTKLYQNVLSRLFVFTGVPVLYMFLYKRIRCILMHLSLFLLRIDFFFNPLILHSPNNSPIRIFQQNIINMDGFDQRQTKTVFWYLTVQLFFLLVIFVSVLGFWLTGRWPYKLLTSFVGGILPLVYTRFS